LTQDGKNLEGLVCLVTGASRGIGAAVARAAAAQRARVVLNYHSSKHEAKMLEKELQGRGYTALAIQADVSRGNDVDRLFTETRSNFGEVDLLVNNAGISLRMLLQETSIAQWNRVIDTNLKSAFLCCRQAIPAMLNKRFGRIVNIASIQGISGASMESVYAASKGGLIALSKSLGSELAPSGITVNTIAPGPVATDMLYSGLDAEDMKLLLDEIPAGRLALPEEIANACIFLLSSEAAYINAQVLNIDGGWKP